MTDVLLLTEFPNSDSRYSMEENLVLKTLKKVRNQFAHQPSLGFGQEEFDSMWEKLVQFFTFYKCSRTDLETLKHSSNLSTFQDENSVGHTNKANSAEGLRLKNEANELYKSGKFEKAINLYSSAIILPGLLESDLATLYSNRSAAYLAMSQSDKNCLQSEEIHSSLQDAKEAIRLNPTWYRGYFRAGNSYMMLRKFKDALDYFDSALSLWPGRDELRQARDNCRMQLGKDSRQEHLDPFQMPVTDEKLINSFETRLGKKFTKEELVKFAATYHDLTPGGSYVRQAHEHMRLATRHDYEQAARLYTIAAREGNAEAMYNLALLYKEGNGIKQDFEMALNLFKEAASQTLQVPGTSIQNVGVMEAEHSLGMCYEEGIGVSQNFVKAAAWYKKASDHGLSSGSNNLAFLYMTGKGVELNFDRGIQYWKLSANQGNALAMRSLAIHYLQAKDTDQAREWHTRSIKHGNFDSKLHEKEFEECAKKIDMENKEVKASLTKWEQENGISDNNITLENRLKRFKERQDPVFKETMDKLHAIYVDGEKKGLSPAGSALRHFDEVILRKSSENGSRTASRILTAMDHFAVVCGLLSTSNSSHNSGRLIHELAQCYRIEELVVQLLPDWKSDICEIVQSVLNTIEESTTSELDLEARICFGFLQMDTLEHTLIFAEHSKRKYNNEKSFHILYGNLCGFLKRSDAGVREIEKSLLLFPDDADLLYCRAVHMRALSETPDTLTLKNIIKAYVKFIAVAPRDHRKVPEAYYAISNLYFHIYKIEYDKKNKTSPEMHKLLSNPEMNKFYQFGLEAEKIQLPCFLPYDSSQKALIENRIDFRSKISERKPQPGANLVKSTHSKLQPPSKSPDYVMLTDPNRVLVIKRHREDTVKRRIKESLENAENIKLKVTTIPPRNAQRTPRTLIGLKPITFAEMDTGEDKVYENSVIQVTSIEDAGVGGFPSIRLTLEDDNRDIHRAFVYNFPENDAKIIQQKLGFGAKMSILNPYMRLAPDNFGIRIDDHTSLFLHTQSGEIKRCRFCGSDNANLSCGRCKLANYCSRKCQELDWKLLKHKLICLTV